MRRRAKVVLSVVVASAALLALFGAQASAEYVQVETFADKGRGPGGTGSRPGELLEPNQADVNDSTGALYVADTGNNRVQVFEGEDLLFPRPTGVAIDQSNGDFYVANSAGISKFDSSLAPAAGWTNPGVTGTLEVDPTSGDLLVVDSGADLIRRFESDGTADGTFPAENPSDLAVTSTGDVLVATATAPVPGYEGCPPDSTIVRFGPTGSQEGTIGGTHVAVGSIDVDPDDGTIVVASRTNGYSCRDQGHPRIEFFDSAGKPLNSAVLSGNALFAFVPGLTMAGGGADVAYVVTRAVEDLSFGNTKIVKFQDKEEPPAIVGNWVDSVGMDSVRLRAEINPEGFATTYRFEYGPSDCSVSACASYPTQGGELAGLVGPTVASFTLTGLQPGTEYHLRVIATNKYGTTVGSDRTFRTRAEIAGPALPDNRAYEMVSPVDKGNFDVLYGTGFQGTWTNSADDGDSVGYTSFGVFADPKGGPLLNQYVADRTETGWVSRNLSVLQAPHKQNLLRFFALSEDLTRGLVANRLENVPGGPGLYVSDLADGSLEPIAEASEADTLNWAVGTPSFDTVAFESWTPLVPEAPSFQGSVYAFRDGQLELASRLPDGTPAEYSAIGQVENSGWRWWANASALSRNGSKLYFTGYDPSQPGVRRVYLRENGVTKDISASQRAVPDTETLDATWQGASEDGAYAFFTSGTKLTDDSVARYESGDLYRYEVATGALVDLTTGDPDGGGFPPWGVGFRVEGISEDGSLVYFSSGAQLAPGANDGSSGLPNLYVYDDSDQSTRLITASVVTDLSTAEPAMSKDGTKFVFLTKDQIGAYDNAGTSQMYLYDHSTGSLTCVSCNPTGARPSGSASGTPALLGPYQQRVNRQARIISWDGETVAFTTSDQLSPQDHNETEDAYLFRNGEAHLISRGRGETPSHFMDMSPDGHDVFFATRDRLVEIDSDNAYDLYDARVGGGIAAQNPGVVTPCSGADCQGQLSPPPAPAAIGTDEPGGRACAPTGRPNRLQQRARVLRGKARKAASPKRARALRRKAAQLERKSPRARQCRQGGVR